MTTTANGGADVVAARGRNGVRLDEASSASPPIWRAVWGARADAPEAVASSARRTLSDLSDLGGVLDGSWSLLGGGAVPSDDLGWTELVAAAVEQDDRGTPLPVRGHRLQFVTQGIDSTDEPYAQLSIVASSTTRNARRPGNSVTLRVEGRGGSDRVYPPLARSAGAIVHSFAEIWRPDAVELVNRSVVDAHIDDLNRPGSWPRIGPLTWLSTTAYPRAGTVTGLTTATTSPSGEGTVIAVGTIGSPDADLEACLPASRELAELGVLGPVPTEQSILRRTNRSQERASRINGPEN